MDPINPDYYVAKNGMESITVIEIFVAGKPYRWAPLKYLFRAGKKAGQDEVQDLKKAIWWIEREIASIEQAREKLNAHVAAVAGRALPPCPDLDGDVSTADRADGHREPCLCSGPCTRLGGYSIPEHRYCKAGEEAGKLDRSWDIWTPGPG